jgi:hypothetical protein
MSRTAVCNSVYRQVPCGNPYMQLLVADLNTIMPVVEAELLKLMERRKRREEEEAYRRRRADVEKHYNHLRSERVEKSLPPLFTFRQLPIVNSLQSTTSPSSSVYKSIQESPLVQELLEDQLEKWRQQARTVLGATLGYPHWKTPSSKKLHPVDRLTARFQCQKCNVVATRYQEDHCLDFAGACAHQCVRPKQKRRPKPVWSADQFVKDGKVCSRSDWRALSLTNVFSVKSRQLLRSQWCSPCVVQKRRMRILLT